MPLQLSAGVDLPCGVSLENRLVKAAMAEGMASSNNLPDDRFIRAYNEWAGGGWGLMITGNVQVDSKYLGQARDVAVSATPSDRAKYLNEWKKWATTCQEHGCPTVVQLNHPGRQSPLFAGSKSLLEKNVAPSAVPLDFGPSLVSRAASRLLFGVPRAMTVEDIQMLIEQFGDSAKLAADAGFKGVEIHAAHGYLLAQFLSPKSNIRNDAYGGSPSKRAMILVGIIRKIRAVTPPSFIVGVKLNSADHQSPAGLQDGLEQIELINAENIDFLEISGGTYEDPTMLQKAEHVPEKAVSTIRREAFFLEFAKIIRERFPHLILMVTGGFRSRGAMEAAITSGACDLIGLARPAATVPHLPKDVILNEEVHDADAKIWLKPIELPALAKIIPVKSLSAGNETKYYSAQIQRMSKGLAPIMPS